MTIPHLAFPFRVAANGSAVVVEQDTIDEIAQNVSVIVSTVEGERIEVPRFGIPDMAFMVNIPAAALMAEVEEWEPRARILVTDRPDVVDELTRLVTITTEDRSGRV